MAADLRLPPRPLRYLLLACGWLALGLGALGIVLPVLPTTPFVLLAGACFLRSSERLHTWLLSSPRFGPPIRDYLEGRGLTRRTKAVALVMLWGSVLASAHFFVEIPAVDVLLIVVAAGVSLYVLSLPTGVDGSPEGADPTSIVEPSRVTEDPIPDGSSRQSGTSGH